MIILVCGGAGSGKSEFAEKICQEVFFSLSCERKIYLATMIKSDSETEKKISIHRQKRKDKGFFTIEQPYELSIAKNYIKKTDVVLLECLSNLLANEMFEKRTTNSIDKRVSYKIYNEILEIEKSSKALIIVSNDVFRDGSFFGEYTKELATLNILIAKSAYEVYEVTAGNIESYKRDLLKSKGDFFERHF